MEKEKVKVYVDGANIFYTQRKLGWSLAWHRVREFLDFHYDILEYRYYIGVKEDNSKVAGYLKYLDAIGFTIKTKPIKVIKVGRDHPYKRLYNYNQIYKSDFDVEIAVDMVFDRNNVDRYILFSGDSDFQYLVKRLKDVGKEVIVFSSRKTLSWELKLEASEYYYLEDKKDIFVRK